MTFLFTITFDPVTRDRLGQPVRLHTFTLTHTPVTLSDEVKHRPAEDRRELHTDEVRG